jgi:hypothetical protein
MAEDQPVVLFSAINHQPNEKAEEQPNIYQIDGDVNQRITPQ